jgi:hypothetical protein
METPRFGEYKVNPPALFIAQSSSGFAIAGHVERLSIFSYTLMAIELELVAMGMPTSGQCQRPLALTLAA